MNNGESVSWRKLREFAGVDLTRSYILSWSVEGDTLCIELDLFLEPEHPFYEKPRPNEKVCIRPAVVEFPYCASIDTNIPGGGEELADAVAVLGLGGIEDLRRFHDGPYEVSGEFGRVRIDAERPILRLRGP
ncbi:MAG: hypothetical protein R3358_09625 [Woeseiaceae bacterium]|nr:hypothetical protein [Woeseiaceae bacterium]